MPIANALTKNTDIAFISLKNNFFSHSSSFISMNLQIKKSMIKSMKMLNPLI